MVVLRHKIRTAIGVGAFASAVARFRQAIRAGVEHYRTTAWCESVYLPLPAR
jgi:hypothetical protein